MSEMVEKVARAICEGKGYEPEYPVSETKVQWETFIETARIAIEAMRDMTDDMAESIANDASVCGGIAYEIWSNALDAALSDND